MTECSPNTPMPAQKPRYIGRFAPSPTGPLHLGSLFTAVASWLHARQLGGQWLVRIEDLDPPREQAGASEQILETLQQWGLESDGPILRQSQRLALYEQALQTLLAQHQAYACSCSRKQIASAELAGPEGWRYNGHCRQHPADTKRQHSIRLDSRGETITFVDELQGPHTENPEQLYGDFSLKRADGFIAYQLAVVVDDAAQGVSHVVRGIDLLSSTSRQIRLQQTLQLPTPQYCHLPVIVEANGQKLSKQNLAEPISTHYHTETMQLILKLLGLNLPNSLKNSTAPALLEWAIQHWEPTGLKNKNSLNLPSYRR